MTTALISVLAAALAAAIAFRWKAVAPHKLEPPSTLPDDFADMLAVVVGKISEVGGRMDALEADHKDVRAAVAHGIEDIERVNNRIAATIRRTKTQLEEHGLESPALDAEAAQLRAVDGGGSEPDIVPPMPEGVVNNESSIPGVSKDELAQIRGYH